MKKVLIFTYLQRHLKKMIPVIKEFEKNKEINLTVVLMTREEREIAEENLIKYKMLDEYTEKIRTFDFDLAWGLEPLINAIDIIKPDLFIAIEVNYILRNAIRYCKQEKIPNLVIQHGTPNIYSLHAFAPFEGDCFACWGEFSKEFLVSNYVDENKIILTGGVPFDRTLSIIPDKEKISSILNIEPDKKWIIFTTQGVGAGNRPSEEEIITGVTEIAKKSIEYKDIQIIFQVHPGQTVEYIKNLVNTVSGHKSIVVKYKDTEELMACSDGIITFFSTTALDAIILKKPLLLINLEEDKDFFPFVRMKSALGAYKKEEIAEAFNKLLIDYNNRKSNIEKTARYINYKNDGNALKRVMELCYSRLN